MPHGEEKLRRQESSSTKAEQYLTILNKMLIKVNSSFHLDDTQAILKDILEVAVETLNFEFATIQLVDHENDTISTVMGMRNRAVPNALDPNKWARVAHPLNPPGKLRDIHAWLLQEFKKGLIVKGWHELFDKAIYEKYSQQELVRAFVPIIAHDPDMYIGTLEAGYNIKNRTNIENEQIVMLTSLANAAAIAIRNHAYISNKIGIHKSRQIVKSVLIGEIETSDNILRTLHAQKHPLSVFLCHSSDDKAAVRELFHRLAADRVDPWFDEEKLLPGHDWDEEIQKAVKHSNIVVVCLSRLSINKAGYVQKEIRYALDVADEQPEGSVFIIPVRLEACDVPKRINRWQWVDLYEEGGYEKLLRTLKHKAIELASLHERKAPIMRV